MSYPSDSGYAESMQGKMVRHGSGQTQNAYLRPRLDIGEPYNVSMSSAFLQDHYRDDTGSFVSVLDSMADQSFPSPHDYPTQVILDPRLAESTTDLAGLLGNDDSTLNQFSEEDPALVNMTHNLAFVPFEQGDPSFPNSSRTNAKIVPWTSLQANQNMAPQQQYYTSSGNPHKRLRRSDDQGYGTPSQTNASPYSASLESPATPVRPSSYRRRSFSSHHMGEDDRGQQRQSFSNHQMLQRLQQPQVLQLQPGYAPSGEAAAQVSHSGPPKTPSRAPKVPRGKKNDKNFPCQTCPKSFPTTNDLERHGRTVHGRISTGSKVWFCELGICFGVKKVWPRLDNFKQHVIRMHGEEYGQNADSMSVSYDPDKHSVEPIKTRNRTQSNIAGGPMAAGLTPSVLSDFEGGSMLPTDITSFQQGMGGGMLGGGPHAATGLRPRSMSTQSQHHTAEFVPQMARGATSIMATGHMSGSIVSSNERGGHHQFLSLPGGQNRGSVRQNRRAAVEKGPPHTIAGSQSFHARQKELEDYHRQDVKARASDIRSNQNDIRHIGSGLSDAPSPLLGGAGGGTINPNKLSRHGQQGFGGSNTINLEASPQMSRSHLDEAIAQFSQNLPAEHRDQFFNLVNKLSNGAQGSIPVNAAPSSRVKRPDGERKARKYTCTKEVGVEGQRSLCGKQFEKPSELKKHEHRHERCYGCTFDHCYKKFGTKWEWKRHERKQHSQNRAWRCSGSDGSQPCARLFDEESAFVDHLEEANHRHRLPASTAHLSSEEVAQECELAVHWSGTFWCGFCSIIVRSTASVGIGRINERYKHISDHIDGEKRDMRDWVEVGGNGRTKGKMRELDKNGGAWKTDQDDFVEPDEQDVSSDEEGGSESSSKRKRPQVDTRSRPFRRPSHASTVSGERRGSSVTNPLIVVSPAVENMRGSDPDSVAGPSSMARRMSLQDTNLGYMPSELRICCRCSNQMSEAETMQNGHCGLCQKDLCQNCHFNPAYPQFPRQQSSRMLYNMNSQYNDAVMNEELSDFDLMLSSNLQP